MINCKNCNTQLDTKSEFCNTCGGKVIRNRLTFRNLFEHLSETFFNYDNKLLRTFIDLFKNPEVVIDGYISGIRKRYVNPISYMGIALTLSGVTFFVMKKMQLDMNFDVFNQGINDDFQSKMKNLTSEYASFMFLSYIPIFVISSWLMLQKYNITERIVTFTYAMAQFSLSVFIPSILFILFAPSHYMNYSLFSLLFLVLYLTWLMYKTTRYKGVEFATQLFVFLFVSGSVFMIYSIGLIVIGLLTGEFSFQDFVPKQ